MTRTKEVEPGCGDIPEYKSPANRLVHSLRRAYDNSREKIKQSRNTIKYYRIKVRDLENSRSRWKESVKEKDIRIKELEENLNSMEKKLLDLESNVKKKEMTESSISVPVKASGYQYDVQQIFLSIQCSLQGAAGFRSVSRIFAILKKVTGFMPAFSTMREWVLKFGLYMLLRPKEKGEWIYVIDTSIQMGSTKALLILGIPLDKLIAKREVTGNFIPSHEDLEPIILKTVDSCSGEVVLNALLEAEQKTGTPISIVSDEGSEFKRGVGLFNNNERQVSHLHDIVHKVDLVIKKEIKEDKVWIKFTKKMTHTTQKLKLTQYAHLIPPKQRQKHRMLGELRIVKWGQSLLRYLDNNKISILFKRKLQWIKTYRSAFIDYQQMIEISKFAIEEVHKNGYYDGISEVFKKQWADVLMSNRNLLFCSKINKILSEEESKVPKGKRLLGSSEVIESLFGKFKNLEKNHASGGLTSLILSLPAIIGKITESTVKTALETTQIEKVWNWVKQNLGCTFWSKRKRDLGRKMKSYLEIDELQDRVV